MRPDHERLREEMVREQIAARGITAERVLAALRKVPRERYVPPALAAQAHDDRPLPIGAGQTISQPYIVAYMLAALALQGGERVLEIGTGSGYAAALLGVIAAQVFTIELDAQLARSARERLAREGCVNVEVRHGDGTLGWPEAAPFDAILVSAGAPRVPAALEQQLAPGGRLLIPVGPERNRQRLVRVTRSLAGQRTEEALVGVHFVPLLGAQGWPAGAAAGLDNPAAPAESDAP